MTHTHRPGLLTRIDAFLSETGMGASYFGKLAVNNSELVSRLRGSGRVWPETEAAVDRFMTEHRARQPAPGQDAGAV